MGMPLTARRFTVDEYQRMGQAGVFHEDDRVELIDGQVVEMTPIGPGHGSCVNRLTALFAPLAGGAATLSVQNPLVLAEHQEPQPDVALLRHRADGYQAGHPRASDVLLVIEVADTSVESDRQTKSPLNARAGIAEAWLVDLPGDRIEVCRDPVAGQYTSARSASRGDMLTPLRLPAVTFSVDAILG
jgi:Uma2 family endonuclease